MNGPLIGGTEECRRIIQAESVLLDSAVTKEHYQISSRIHTDRVYLLHPVLQWGSHRELLAHKLIEDLLIGGIDLQRDVDVLVATGIAAMQICCTLQHFIGLQEKRLIFIERERNGISVGHGFSFRQDERILLVHFAAVRFNTIRETIKAIHRYADETGFQPCVIGFAVIFDRSPENSQWEKGLGTFRKVCMFREPLNVYPADKRRCPLCKMGIPLVDLRGAT
ncbi:MAG: hypothetical protein A3J58_01150 [Candidatus Sungbacteria bacterium RIFCSPHIGHO2_02_FULL_52_23]|uniref:Orotate phosphoribosyltransferase n=1 Tax=Candidatus Sungbacteria bacterium RIFCSPHIGHO2_02_FULL_52_23 TaxID=1802274 RepID=A0A1G2KXP2_9BACT|nr:MAG: hypothetical protein A3J58_01150 [Candidatus Sungbacteria bacterium RIFCSPHIGHO2_02_FULL_52_23]